jgi:hypothetical protein
MVQTRDWQLGEHLVRFEVPDILLFKLRGPLRYEDARRITTIYREVAAQGPVFTIADVSDTSIDKEARAYFAEHLRPEWYRSIALIGASLLQRAAIKSILVGLYLRGGWELFPEFVESEAQARAYSARKRAQQHAPRAA